jgi:hypothetical protein
LVTPAAGIDRASAQRLGPKPAWGGRGDLGSPLAPSAGLALACVLAQKARLPPKAIVHFRSISIKKSYTLNWIPANCTRIREQYFFF